MERGNFAVIAIVIAAIALFALRFFGESREDERLAALSATDRAGQVHGSLDGGTGGGTGGRDGHSGGPNTRLGARSGSFGEGGAGSAGSASGGASRGASAATAFGGGMRGGGSVGTSSSGSAASGGGGASIADSAARTAPKAERRADLVESLSALPKTKSDLEAAKPADRGDDVALQVNTTKDITDQDGQAVGEVKDDSEQEGVKFADNTRVEFPNPASKEGSISFTIKPDWGGADATDNALVQIRAEHEWNNRLEIVKNGEFLRFILTDNTGKEADISARITDWQPGQEKAIEFSWGNGRTEATVDNQVVGRNEYPGELQFSPNTPMIFGADHPGSTYGSANATISNFTVGKSSTFTQQ